MDELYDYNLFDNALDNENDDDAATESIIVAQIGGIIYLITAAIAQARSAARDYKLYKNMKGTFLSIDKLIQSGIPKEKAVSEYKKTLKFLISKNFVNDNITTKSTTIYYSDLNESGQAFIAGYYMKIGKIDTYTVKKAVEYNKSKLVKSVKTGNIIAAIAETLMYIIGSVMTGGISVGLGITCAIMGLICGGLSISLAAGNDYRERFFDTHQPMDDDKDNKDAKESANIYYPEYFDF